jgi:hypothetical protein
MAPRNRPLVRRSILILTIAGLSVVAVSLAFVDVVPKRAITPSAMTETSVRIEMYYQRNKRLPADLDVLPVRENYANRTTDAWNRPLRYAVDSDDTFTLTSLGEDGAPGGTGDDADVIRKYRVEHGEVQSVP